MYDLRLIRLLVLPSFVSGIVVGLLAALLIGYNAWLYVSEEQLFYDYLFGIYGLKTYVWQHSQAVTTWQGAFFANPVVYYVLLGMAGIAVGMVVYFLLQLFGLVSNSVKQGMNLLHGQNTTTRLAARELLTRLGLRLMSLVCWGFYMAFFVSIMLPFVVVLNQLGIDLIHQSNGLGWLACVGAFALLFVALHLHIIFLRLLFLRPRVFGGDRDIVEAEAQANTHDAQQD